MPRRLKHIELGLEREISEDEEEEEEQVSQWEYETEDQEDVDEYDLGYMEMVERERKEHEK